MIKLDKKYLLAVACSVGLGLSIASTSALAGAIIKYGDTYLGVNNEGQLNISANSEVDELGNPLMIPAGLVGAGVGSQFFGSAPDDIIFGLYRNGVGDSTSPGCLCEGWGVAATLSDGTGDRIAGGANENTGGAFGISGGEFGSTSSTATSSVYLNGSAGLSGEFEGGGDFEGPSISAVAAAEVTATIEPIPDDTLLTVTHAFGPSLAEGVFQVSVSITNNTDSAVNDLVYRRAMDWDIPPTEFAEYVTHGGVEDNLEANGGNVRYASDNGFASADPRNNAGFQNSETVNVDFEDNGPADHGSVFDFAFGELDAGDSRTFNIFYGSTGNEADALNAITLLGADVFSLGQQSGSADDGEPATFLFAFGGVGGVEPGETADVPVLPFVTAPGEFVFTSPEPGLWFDPPFADGFAYELTGGATFTEVGTPDASFGFGDVDVVVGGVVVGTIAPGGLFDLSSYNTSTFSLVGLDTLLDLADPTISTAFPVLLDFTGTVTTLLMSTILAVTPTVGVPEPAPFVIMLSCVAVMFFRKKS